MSCCRFALAGSNVTFQPPLVIATWQQQQHDSGQVSYLANQLAGPLLVSIITPHNSVSRKCMVHIIQTIDITIESSVLNCLEIFLLNIFYAQNGWNFQRNWINKAEKNQQSASQPTLCKLSQYTIVVSGLCNDYHFEHKLIGHEGEFASQIAFTFKTIQINCLIVKYETILYFQGRWQ